MSYISSSITGTTSIPAFSIRFSTPPSKFSSLPTLHPSSFRRPTPSCRRRKAVKLLPCRSSNLDDGSPASEEEEDDWRERAPDKKKPLYSHSLPCIEAWLEELGFRQSKEDRAVWLVEKPDWRAQLSLDLTDLYIRYLKSGPGSLEKDVERRFSYALSREDIENAVLGGP
ncbi:unnamed protein product [Linum tenue]|uniref:Uncharacterized protein n=1 Tax=Linum tenue TaxID=586396 RepID=A0AAV0MTW3_9ROSI|nr:unnamed protein product [Linum tenue]